MVQVEHEAGCVQVDVGGGLPVEHPGEVATAQPREAVGEILGRVEQLRRGQAHRCGDLVARIEQSLHDARERRFGLAGCVECRERLGADHRLGGR